ncbi:MAG TPA: UDP-N-acetylmuramoyl-L-alanine--D-glutamate ligase [Solirubrobacteraceae bacterium]|jgi:UDP-N-acetylmuramoylalanine--D-glutamate ligase|nr:UDP-N-acetylmuramoyl-L-alanine--D-glutamate ligase [Solirubrobacteraceae bacterium]
MSLRFSELDGASVGVWGAGREIISFAAQLARHLPLARIAVVALDAVPDEDVRATLGVSGARLAIGADVTAALADCDVVVRSPGVSTYRPELRKLRGAGIPVTTATALWLAERNGSRVIGVTGTKGKSTTATLLAHLARSGSQTVALAGNIGVPALDLFDRPSTELAIVELSSYQIADLETGPEVAVITNLFREHTDWHGSEENYRSDKLRILRLVGVRATVINGRDPQLIAVAPKAVEPTFFGVPQGWDVSPDGLSLNGGLVVPAAELPLRGEHNALNLCAALAALSAAGIVTPQLPGALRGFKALPHRLTVVGEHNGLTWVDDSISTTPESTLAALASFPDREVVLLGGGQDRGQDYAELGRVLAARKAAVVGVPTTGDRLVKAARAAGVPGERALDAPNLEGAVARALALARPGSVVLLSPAAPSYDTYRNFEERGRRFRALAQEG